MTYGLRVTMGLTESTISDVFLWTSDMKNKRNLTKRPLATDRMPAYEKEQPTTSPRYSGEQRLPSIATSLHGKWEMFSLSAMKCWGILWSSSTVTTDTQSYTIKGTNMFSRSRLIILKNCVHLCKKKKFIMKYLRKHTYLSFQNLQPPPVVEF